MNPFAWLLEKFVYFMAWIGDSLYEAFDEAFDAVERKRKNR